MLDPTEFHEGYLAQKLAFFAGDQRRMDGVCKFLGRAPAGLWIPGDPSVFRRARQQEDDVFVVEADPSLRPLFNAWSGTPRQFLYGQLDYLDAWGDPFTRTNPLPTAVFFSSPFHLDGGLVTLDAGSDAVAFPGQERMSVVLSPTGEFAYSIHLDGEPAEIIRTGHPDSADVDDRARGVLQALLMTFARRALVPEHLRTHPEVVAYVQESLANTCLDGGETIDELPPTAIVATVRHSPFSSGFSLDATTVDMLPGTVTRELELLPATPDLVGVACLYDSCFPDGADEGLAPPLPAVFALNSAGHLSLRQAGAVHAQHLDDVLLDDEAATALAVGLRAVSERLSTGVDGDGAATQIAAALPHRPASASIDQVFAEFLGLQVLLGLEADIPISQVTPELLEEHVADVRHLYAVGALRDLASNLAAGHSAAGTSLSVAARQIRTEVRQIVSDELSQHPDGHQLYELLPHCVDALLHTVRDFLAGQTLRFPPSDSSPGG